MVDLLSTAEEVLDQYWLLVWRHLVEIHWDDVRDYDCYSFFSLRKNRCQPKESIDAEVADLAIDYWERNRFKLKEHFINLTCGLWPNKETAVYKDLYHNGWIDCGVDPASPGKVFPNDVNTSWLNSNIKSAKISAFNDIAIIKVKRWKKIDRRRKLAKKKLRKAKLRKFAAKIKSKARCIFFKMKLAMKSLLNGRKEMQ